MIWVTLSFMVVLGWLAFQLAKSRKDFETIAYLTKQNTQLSTKLSAKELEVIELELTNKRLGEIIKAKNAQVEMYRASAIQSDDPAKLRTVFAELFPPA